MLKICRQTQSVSAFTCDKIFECAEFKSCQLIVDLDKENEKFNEKAADILKSLTETQKQKLVAVKKLKVAAVATEYHRKKQRIFLRSTAELEHRIQEAQEKLNTATVKSF